MRTPERAERRNQGEPNQDNQIFVEDGDGDFEPNEDGRIIDENELTAQRNARRQ